MLRSSFGFSKIGATGRLWSATIIVQPDYAPDCGASHAAFEQADIGRVEAVPTLLGLGTGHDPTSYVRHEAALIYPDLTSTYWVLLKQPDKPKPATEC